jgi:hypothetical protein
MVQMGRAPARIAAALACFAIGSGCGGGSSEPSSPDLTTQDQTTIADAAGESTTAELPPGAKPSLPVEAYWFGPMVGAAEAITAREIRSHGPSYSYSVYYELPSAEGRTSAEPGKAPPPGEIHVINLARRGEVIRKTIATYEQGKQATITLAGGEEATFFPFPGPSEVGFAVVTKSTLIQVLGPGVTLLVEEERKAMAVRLRPL